MSKLQAAEKTFEFFFNRLVKGYKSVMGREPEGLDLIKIRQEAKTKQIDANKVVEVQFGKPFGEEVNALIKSGDVNIGTANKTPPYTPSKSQTDFELQEKFRANNEKAIEAFKKRNPKDEMATGGRAGYAVGNQVTPAVDQRMNLDYDTLVNQNTAQRTTQAQNRNPFQKHFDNNQLLKNAVSRGELSSADYNRLGGFDVAQTMGGGNPVLGGIGNLVGSTAYNAYQSIKDGQPILEGIKDIGRNVQGGTGLISNDLKTQYENIINQKAATPTPNASTDRPTMADVAGPAATGGGYAGDTNNVVSKDPLGLIQQINKLRNGQTPFANYSYQPEEGGYVAWDGTSYSVVNPEQIKRDIEAIQGLASGGRAGYYGGGQAMVGEDLSEIGHGADALMARNMQLSPNGQATTSTGLNYLLGQDNETVRVPYNKGKAVAKVADKGRRGFMKAAGAAGAGIAALKTGLLGFGEKVAPVAKEAVEAVSNTASQVPAYFLNLVSKIKMMGDDVTQKAATQDRQKVTTYKDYTLTEDVATGRQEIQRMKVLDDDSASYYGQPLTEETYMSYTPGETIIGKGNKPIKTGPEYEEGTALLRSDRGNAGEVVEESATISDDVIKEGNYTFDKADGGRIGYGKGDIVTKGGPALIKAGEGAFTKAQYLIERIKNTIKGSPDDKYVQETFPNFIKELEANPDLAKNENVFKELGGDLPEGQQIVVYGDDTLDFFTTSSGPKNIKKLENFMAKHNLPKDQALKIMKMEPNDQVMELTKTKFLKQKRTDNASGGIATMLGE